MSAVYQLCREHGVGREKRRARLCPADARDDSSSRRSRSAPQRGRKQSGDHRRWVAGHKASSSSRHPPAVSAPALPGARARRSAERRRSASCLAWCAARQNWRQPSARGDNPRASRPLSRSPGGGAHLVSSEPGRRTVPLASALAAFAAWDARVRRRSPQARQARLFRTPFVQPSWLWETCRRSPAAW